MIARIRYGGSIAGVEPPFPPIQLFNEENGV
jgi:hypothetical protein